jgi:hypothetical protein
MKQIHEYAKFFPPMEGEEFKALCQDVKKHGLLNPIVLHEDKILDGRNRARACEEVGVRPKYETFTNGNPFDYVVSQNVLRRHLTTSQRAVLALELEKKFAAENHRGGNQKGASATLKKAQGQSAERAAKALHVGSYYVKSAKRLAKEAPEFIPAVRAGKITVKEALIKHLDNRAEDRAKKEASAARVKHLQKESRQVAEYLAATKQYVIALKLAEASVERFSKEAVGFVIRKHEEVRRLMLELENALKK